MTKPQRQLRLIQAVCFVVLGACIVLTYWHAHESAETFSTLGFVQVNTPAILTLTFHDLRASTTLA